MAARQTSFETAALGALRGDRAPKQRKRMFQH